MAPSVDGVNADAVDRLVGFLEDSIADDARGARTLQDVNDVASRVQLLRMHRPVSVAILAMTNADESNYQELGFITADGSYIGVNAPQILCDHHHNMEQWPCAAIRSLARRYCAHTGPGESGQSALLEKLKEGAGTKADYAELGIEDWPVTGSARPPDPR